MPIAPPPRQRAPEPASTPIQPLGPYGKKAVGGPREKMRYGLPHHTEGRTTRSWPFRAGDELIGWIVHEYQTKKRERVFYNGADISYVGTHAWQLRKDEWRYLGVFSGQDQAKARINMAHQRSKAEVIPLQQVAPPSRIRRKA